MYNLRQLEARESRLNQTEEAEQEAPAGGTRQPLADKPVAVTASLFRFQERPKPARPRCDGKENEQIRDKVRTRFVNTRPVGDPAAPRPVHRPCFRPENGARWSSSPRVYF